MKNAPLVWQQLRDIFSHLYANPADAERVTRDAAIEAKRIRFDGTIVNIWQAILQEAEKCEKLESLFQIALTEYGSNQQLLAVVDVYRTSLSASSTSPALSVTESKPTPPVVLSGHTPEPSQPKQELAWLRPLLSIDEMTLLDECLAAFKASRLDRSKLADTTEQVAELEKQYIIKNPTQLVDKQLNGSILVCTVGMRPLPVILTTLIIKPKKLYLLHSQQSLRGAETVRDDPYVQQLGLVSGITIQLLPISLTDAPDNYIVLQKIVRENPNEKIVVDISGGVKVMGVSLAAAAFWKQIPVIYQLGEEVAGIIKPFSERLVLVENPLVYFGSAELRSIGELFGQAEYDAALTVCDNLRESTGDVSTLGKLQILDRFIQIYRDWDAFAHSSLEDDQRRKLALRLGNVINDMVRLKLQFADEAELSANQTFLQKLQDSWTLNQRNNSERYRLIDIYASARRRAKTGKYDDAVARLYRCLEMSATICLERDCGIGTVKQPNFAYFIERLGTLSTLQEQFAKQARYPLPTERLGLKDQMMLLRLSDQNQHKAIAGLYQGIEQGDLLEKRNRSILAHGTVPIQKEAYQALETKTYAIITRVITDQEECAQLLQQATHPVLKLDL